MIRRATFKTSATGASAPTEIWQRVRRIRPEDYLVVLTMDLKAKNPSLHVSKFASP